MILLFFLLVFFMLGFFFIDLYETLDFMWVENRNLTICILLISFVLIYYFVKDYVLFMIYFFSDTNLFN